MVVLWLYITMQEYRNIPFKIEFSHLATAEQQLIDLKVNNITNSAKINLFVFTTVVAAFRV